VRAEKREARLAIVKGVPKAISAVDDETLGDVLARRGELDRVAHQAALETAPPVGPVGQWLIDVGAASREAVEAALSEQLARRVAATLGWPSAELRFRAGLADVGVAHVNDAREPADLVLSSLREAVQDVPLLLARRRLGLGVVVLSRLGESLVDAAKLTPVESAMMPLLRQGAPVDVVLAMGGGAARAIRSLYALHVLSAITAPTAGRQYSLLLRKQRQLRRAAGATSLLDIPHDADAPAARRALRRLARAVHPDRFDGEAEPAVQKASREVMEALVAAERIVGR
jgi:hypothetical protein